MNNIFTGILSIKNSKSGNITQKHIFDTLRIKPKIYKFNPSELKDVCSKTHNSGYNHTLLAEYALKSKKKYALFFEDDVRFYKFKEVKNIFYKIINDLDNLNFDCIQLSAEPVILNIQKQSNYIYKMPLGTCIHATIYSQKGLQKLFELRNKIPQNINNDRLCNEKMNGSINQIDVRYIPFFDNYVVYPPLCYQNKCPSFYKDSNCDHAVKIQNKLFMSQFFNKTYLLFILILALLIYFKKIHLFVSIIFCYIMLTFLLSFNSTFEKYFWKNITKKNISYIIEKFISNI